MNTVGIVCEYNPLHTGHKRQIDILRENGAKVIICAMSGNFTQRGELTVADKYTRAETAVKCGADIVLELPFPYSSMSAEGFCAAGVHILSSLGCDTLSFGSESTDISLLKRAAKEINSDDFISAYTAAQKSTGSAKAYFDILSQRLGGEAKLLSNDILGISYISAILRSKSDMEIFAIKREGAAYSSEEIGNSYPSATAIRKAARLSGEGFFSIGEDNIPAPALEVLKEAQIRYKIPIFTDDIGSDILSFFKLMSPDEITSRAINRSRGGRHIASDGCGIVERLCGAAKSSASFGEMLESTYTSRYTDARINRVILFSVLGVSDAFEKSLPEFTTLLAASEAGRKHLSEIRKTASLPIVTKPADAPECALADVLKLSDLLYSSAISEAKPDFFLKKHPYMG